MRYLGGGVGHLEQFPPANNDDEYEVEVEDDLDTGGTERNASNQDNGEGEGEEGEGEGGEGEGGGGEGGEDDEGRDEDEEGEGDEDADPGESCDEEAGNVY